MTRQQTQVPFFKRFVGIAIAVLALSAARPTYGQAVNLEWSVWPMYATPQVYTGFYHPNTDFHDAVHYAAYDWSVACYFTTLYSTYGPRLQSGTTGDVVVAYGSIPSGFAAQSEGYDFGPGLSGAAVFINYDLMPPSIGSLSYRIKGSPLLGIDFETTMRHELGHVHTIGHGGVLMQNSIPVGTSQTITGSDCAMLYSKYP